MSNLNINYSLTSTSIIEQPKLVENYRFRIPMAFELISDKIINDSMVSTVNKSWYVKINGDLVTTEVNYPFVNNIWNYSNTLSLKE